jgi:Protein of unknown function (DUF3179)
LIDNPLLEGPPTMAEADLDPPSVPDVPIPPRRRFPWIPGLACVAILPLLGFIGQAGQTLWGEWKSLREDQVSERESAIVGYVNINPNPSFAERPPDWFHDEGDTSLLWSGWRDGQNHWFRVGQGEIEGELISLPIGKDVIQAIDYPLFEQDGGDRWLKVPAEAPVVGFEDRDSSTAYPLKVLNKVMLVNHQIGDRAVLVAFTPVEDSVSIFDATLNGNRVTMGHSGYFFKHHPVLYDRGTESLWSERDGAMVAVAGRRKGASLKRIARLQTVAWSDWKGQNPNGKLLIGADRSKSRPAD